MIFVVTIVKTREKDILIIGKNIFANLIDQGVFKTIFEKQ